jgi:hypothetical protein
MEAKGTVREEGATSWSALGVGHSRAWYSSESGKKTKLSFSLNVQLVEMARPVIRKNIIPSTKHPSKKSKRHTVRWTAAPSLIIDLFTAK